MRNKHAAILSLNHSCAAIERAISQFKLIKNERRTNLSNEICESLLLTQWICPTIKHEISSMNFLNLIIFSVKNVKELFLKVKQAKKIMENSTTATNVGIFQSQDVKKQN